MRSFWTKVGALALTASVAGIWTFAQDVQAQCEITSLDSFRPEASEFGRGVAVAQTFMAVGSPLNQISGRSTGAVYVYSGVADEPWNWSLSQTITVNSINDNEEFGWSVAANDEVLVVGARRGDLLPSPSNSNTGRIYIYKRNQQGLWVLSDLPVPLTPQQNERHGHAVAIDGTTIAVGSDNYNQPNGVTNGGRVVVYELAEGSTDHWVESQSISPAGLVQTSRFGSSVSIKGNTLIVGAPGDNAVSGGTSGAAYLYTRNSVNPKQWDFVAKLVPATPTSTSGFGVSVFTDDISLAVGAQRETFTGLSTQTGVVYVYRRNLPGTGAWMTGSPVRIAPPASVGSFSQFGVSVSIKDDLLHVAANRFPGGPTFNTGPKRGAVFLYAREAQSQQWTYRVTLTKSNPQDNEEFGTSLAVRTPFVVGGAFAREGGRGAVNGFLAARDMPSCDDDTVWDLCEIAQGTAIDCDGDGIPDGCALEAGEPPIAVWTAEYKGVFSDPNSWCADIPTPSHKVIFRHPTPDGLPNEFITITSATVRSINVRKAEPMLISVAGSKLRVIDQNNAFFNGRPVLVATTPEHARLDLFAGQLEVGTPVDPGSLVLAPVVGSSASMRLSEPSTQLNVSNVWRVGEKGPASVSIARGARAQPRYLEIGSLEFAGGSGVVALPNPDDVNTPASVLTVEAIATVARGTLELENRAVFVSPRTNIERDGVVRTDATLQSDVFNFGRLRRLNTIGQIRIEGAYQQVEGFGQAARLGRLELNLGAGGGQPHDSLWVRDNARLRGGLIIKAEPGFDPPLDSVINIIQAGSLPSDRFMVASFPALPGQKYLRLRYDEITKRVDLLVDALAPNADTSFGSWQGYTFDDAVTAGALGRFGVDRGGGLPDLAATAPGASSDIDLGGYLFICPNTGATGAEDQRFGQAVNIAIESDPIAIAVADFNGDGVDDIVVIDRARRLIQILHSINIDGELPTFSRRTYDAGMSNPQSVAVGDFDNNGRFDVMVGGDNNGTARIFTMLNLGSTGTVWNGLGFSRSLPSTTGSFVRADTGDLDNDKRLPFWMWGLQNDDGNSEVVIMRNLQGGQLASWSGFQIESRIDLNFLALAADTGDLDNDKILAQSLDLMFAGSNDGEGVVATLISNGNGTFGPPALISFGGPVDALVIANLDSDDDLDAAVIVDDPDRGRIVQILRNDFDTVERQLAFTVADAPTSSGIPLYLFAGDVDNIGGADLIIINDPLPPGGLPVPRGGLPDISLLPSISEGLPPCPADMNGDGVLDFFDVQQFLQWMAAQDPRANLNGDALIDFFDLQLFLSLYSAGCP